MRFLIKDESGEELLILNDTLNAQRIGWFLIDSIVEGWYGTPAPRETVLGRYSSDGDAWPPSLTQGARTVSIYGALEAKSSIEATAAINDINSLFGKSLTITGEDAAGRKHIDGFLSDDPMPTFLPGECLVRFSLVFTCPYPVKRGDYRTYTSSGTNFTVHNGGNAPAYPIIEITGSTQSVTISYGSHTVSWSGTATNKFYLDLAADLSGVSGIVKDDAFAVPPGDSTIKVTSSGGEISVYLADAWR